MNRYSLYSERLSTGTLGLPYKWKRVVDLLVTNLIGILGPIVLPPLHIYILYHFWHQYSRRVDRHYCTCSCWDTVFKGTYESGIASYKHVYFNATRNSVKIWVLTVICAISLYEAVKKLTSLLLKRRLRYSMLVLFTTSIFSHYYSWWSFVNYWNDDFYSQWQHQLFFSLTEVLSTLLVLRLADIQIYPGPLTVLPVVAIATGHVVISAWDQFISNVVNREGSPHQVLRDLGFMVPDLLHILLPLLQLFLVSPRNPNLRRDFLVFFSIITLCLIVCLYLTRDFES